MSFFSEIITLKNHHAVTIQSPDNQPPVLKTVIFVDGDVNYYVDQARCTPQLIADHMSQLQQSQQRLARDGQIIQWIGDHSAKVIVIVGFIGIGSSLSNIEHWIGLSVVSLVSHSLFHRLIRALLKRFL